jgi:hypothetical protein
LLFKVLTEEMQRRGLGEEVVWYVKTSVKGRICCLHAEESLEQARASIR